MSKEDAMNFIIEKFNPLHYLVAHELHANGDHHLHCYLSLDEPIRTRDPRFADLPGPFHGNYQGCRSPRNVLKYCTKEEDYCGNVDVSSIDGSNLRKRAFTELVNGSKTLTDIIDENPSLLSGYCKLKLDLLTFNQDRVASRPSMPNWLPNPWGKVLLSCKKSKKKHYWIYSRQPNVGKTFHFALPLVREYRGIVRTGSEPYWIISGDEEFIILDEYNAAIFPYYQLNAMCDSTFQFRVFHQGVRVLNNMLIIVLSNKPIHELYPNMNHLIYARFNEIEIN